MTTTNRPLKVLQFCECSSFKCNLRIVLPQKEVLRRRKLKLIMIMKGCPNGPDSTDTLVARYKEYSYYKEGPGKFNGNY